MSPLLVKKRIKMFLLVNILNSWSRDGFDPENASESGCTLLIHLRISIETETDLKQSKKA
jgi:hypothetical protein